MGAGHAGIDHVVAIESRGFILGAPVAYELGAGLVLVRKIGKLPSATYREDYGLEYGVSSVEIHTDAIAAGEHVLIVDDVLATGGRGGGRRRYGRRRIWWSGSERRWSASVC